MQQIVGIVTLSYDILFFMTTPILIWLICNLKLITMATQSHTLSCQIQCLYPRVVSNLIVFQLRNVLLFHLGWLSSAWSSFFYYMVWVLVYHSVSYDCWTYSAIPTSVLKPEFNSVKNLQLLTSSVTPFLNKIVNSFGVIDFAFFCFSKIVLKPSTKLGVLNRQWILHKCQ